MQIVDHNMRDMLQFFQEIARILYVCMDSRVNHLVESLSNVNDRISGMKKLFVRLETRLSQALNTKIIESEKRTDLKIHDAKLIAYIQEKIEAWVLHLARIEADKSAMIIKKEAVKESVADAVQASIASTEMRLSQFHKTFTESGMGRPSTMSEVNRSRDRVHSVESKESRTSESMPT